MKLTRKNQKEISVLSFEMCHAKTTENGKPGMSVQEHCRVVGYVARNLLTRLPESVLALLPECAATIAALHDVGKVSPGFQKKYFNEHLESAAARLAAVPISGNFETDHAAIGAAAVNRFFNSPYLLCAVAQIVGLHHGAIRKPILTDTGGVFGGKLWAEERTKLIRSLIAEFGGEGVRDGVQSLRQDEDIGDKITPTTRSGLVVTPGAGVRVRC